MQGLPLTSFQFNSFIAFTSLLYFKYKTAFSVANFDIKIKVMIYEMKEYSK
jgi:hypothetical protein